MRATCLLMLPVLLAGCACPEVPDVRRLAGQNLATPENSLEYFRAAVEQEQPHHEYLLFSEALKEEVLRERGNRFSFSNYLLARSRILDVLREKVGEIADIEVLDARYLGPHEAIVTVEGGGHRADIRMVLERLYGIWLWDGTFVDQPPLAASDAPVVAGPDGGLVLRLPWDAEVPAASRDVYRIDYEAAWKIRRLEGSDIAPELGDALRRAAEAEAEIPPDGNPDPR